MDFGGRGAEPAGGDLQASSVSSAAELRSALTLRRGRESRYVHVMDFPADSISVASSPHPA